MFVCYIIINMHPRFEKAPKVELDQHEHERWYPATGLEEIAQELGAELKLAFAEASQRFLEEHSDLSKNESNKEFSVEIYERANDVYQRVKELQGEEAASHVPKNNAVLVVTRFPPLFAYKPEEEFSPKADFKYGMTKVFWNLRDEFEEAFNVEIERVNPVHVHEDAPLAGYYYIWLITPPGKMPELFRTRDDHDEDDEDWEN